MGEGTCLKKIKHPGLLTLRAAGFLSYHHFQKAFYNSVRVRDNFSNHVHILYGDAKTLTLS